MNIENKKQVATILLAVGLGLVAAFLTSQYIQSAIQQQTALLAKEYTKQSATLKKELEITKGEIGQLVQRQEALAKQLREQPRVVQVAEAPKQVVDTAAFSIVTPPGKRAVTIQIDSLSAVGGLISPGDFVDVMARLKIPEDESAPSSKVREVTTFLFQDIQVLAVGANFKSSGTAEVYQSQQRAGALYVTLAVTPEEAGLLSFVQTHADLLRFSLRSPSEEGRQALQSASWESLSSYILDQQGTDLSVPKKIEEKPSAAVEEKPKEKENKETGPSIQIFRGGKEL